MNIEKMQKVAELLDDVATHLDETCLVMDQALAALAAYNRQTETL